MFSTKKTAPILSKTSNSILNVTKMVLVYSRAASVFFPRVSTAGFDLMASLMAFLSIWAAAKPADDRHQFGATAI